MEEWNLLEEYGYTYIGRDGTVEERTEEVLAEYGITIFVNGTAAGRVTCIPEHLELLVLGRLLTEGLISSLEDVRQLSVSREDGAVYVSLTNAARVLVNQPLLNANHTANDAYVVSQEMKHVLPIPWKQEWIFDLADHFAAGSPLHEKTWATHSCILAREGEILFTCEDISRHNALDKVIGYALKNGIPLTRSMVYSSGRIPTDMAAKAIRAGIPILVSKASPTNAAIALARQSELTLICAARRDRMKLFSGRFTK